MNADSLAIRVFCLTVVVVGCFVSGFAVGAATEHKRTAACLDGANQLIAVTQSIIDCHNDPSVIHPRTCVDAQVGADWHVRIKKQFDIATFSYVAQ